jgi:hypothetical protein
MHYLCSVYFVNQPLHVLGIFVAHHQEVYCIYTTICMCCAFQLTDCWPGWDGWDLNLTNRQSTEKHKMYQLFYIYSIPPDDGLQICPKHVEVDWWNKLSINSASSWVLLHRLFEVTEFFKPCCIEATNCFWWLTLLWMICLSSDNAESPVAIHTDSFVRNSEHLSSLWECIQSKKCMVEL